jgi:arylsulfatase A-like enzyme
MRLSLVLLLGLLLTALDGSAARPPRPAPPTARPPNIVFILADDLGIHDLGCYGRTEHRTPNLDRLAREGTRFTSAYCAQPICSPSRAAILTGLTPARLHLTTYLPGRADAASQKVLHPVIQQQLPLARVTLAEHLKGLGYNTACIGKWHLGGPGFDPARQGFDVVHAGRANTPPSDSEGGKGEFDLTRQAIAFMEQNRDRPFFLYLAHNTPHIPYAEREDHVRAHSEAFEPAYAAVIESMDASVGRLLAAIDQLGLAEETLVIFTSDNGGLHVPELQHARITHNGPFRAGKGYLYEGGLRIPLLVRWPGRVPADRQSEAPVINTDWLPTLLELTGHPLPADAPIDGVSFASRLLGKKPRTGSRPLFWHFPHYTNQGGRPGGAVRDGRWKLIRPYDAPGYELYDLRADPGETRNLAARNPRRVRVLAHALDSWTRSTGAQTNRPNASFDESRFRELYLDFDPSRFSPTTATPADWSRITAWRRAMDTAVSKP